MCSVYWTTFYKHFDFNFYLLNFPSTYKTNFLLTFDFSLSPNSIHVSPQYIPCLSVNAKCDPRAMGKSDPYFDWICMDRCCAIWHCWLCYISSIVTRYEYHYTIRIVYIHLFYVNINKRKREHECVCVCSVLCNLNAEKSALSTALLRNGKRIFCFRPHFNILLTSSHFRVYNTYKYLPTYERVHNCRAYKHAIKRNRMYLSQSRKVLCCCSGWTNENGNDYVAIESCVVGMCLKYIRNILRMQQRNKQNNGRKWWQWKKRKKSYFLPALSLKNERIKMSVLFTQHNTLTHTDANVPNVSSQLRIELELCGKLWPPHNIKTMFK